MKKLIEIPSECPACNFPLTTINMQLFCLNTGCFARSSKQIEHFAKTLSIKGLGEKTIEKLNLTDITEIYSLTQSKIEEALGSEKLASKLYNEIQKSTRADLATVIASFGIPLIGNTASKKLCNVIHTIDDITLETCKTAGLGDIASNNLINFLQFEFTEIREYLPFSFKKSSSISSGSTAKSKNVCLTGKLFTFKHKADAKIALNNAGFNVVESVTKSTDYLVDEENKGSSKRIKADSLGILIISDLSKFLKENI